MTVDLKGFKALNLEFTFNKEKQTRQIFVQKHNVKKTTEDKPLGKTLFLINIPPYIDVPELQSAFGSLGAVENVIIAENTLEHSTEEKNSNNAVDQSKYFNKTNEVLGFKVAYVVFKLTKSLEKALKVSKVSIVSNEDGSSKLFTGVDKWTKQYQDSWIDEKGLQAEVEDYMLAFEKREQEEREEAKKTEVDEDGWTVVKRKTGGFQQKESILKALEDKIEKGKEKKEFNNFYAFQIRQSKQKHIVSLRKKFAQDKLKIEALKKARRFKPF